MKTAALVLTVLLISAGSPSQAASARKPPSARAAMAALRHLLVHRYGSVQGDLTCPADQYDGVGLGCTAEVRAGKTWHQLSAEALLTHGRVTFTHLYAVCWRRHWWPYSRHSILRSHEGQVPGVVSVNSPAYDWGWLALCARSLKGRAGRCDALDGQSQGLMRFYFFNCFGSRTVTCTNALGDVMRYRP